MRKVCCAGYDHSRTKKGQRIVDSTFGMVQSRKAGYIDVSVEIYMLLDHVLGNHFWCA